MGHPHLASFCRHASQSAEEDWQGAAESHGASSNRSAVVAVVPCSEGAVSAPVVVPCSEGAVGPAAALDSESAATVTYSEPASSSETAQCSENVVNSAAAGYSDGAEESVAIYLEDAACFEEYSEAVAEAVVCSVRVTYSGHAAELAVQPAAEPAAALAAYPDVAAGPVAYLEGAVVESVVGPASAAVFVAYLESAAAMPVACLDGVAVSVACFEEGVVTPVAHSVDEP